MTRDTKLPTSRMGRFSSLASMGLRAGSALLRDRASDAAAQHAAEVLGNLRGIAAKVGQMASYVDGVVPESQGAAYESAMRVLQTQTPRSDSAAVRACIEQELGAPLDQLFAAFEEEPFASASIGQVHKARMHDGLVVAVKVQHPGIEQALESDLANAGVVKGLAALIGGKRIDAKAVFQVIEQRFREELDYELEARRLCAFRAAHQGDPTIRIPRWIRSHSSRRVLTTEWMQGVSFEEACAAPERERRAYAETMWRFVFKPMLRHGLLMVDPHPGNYLFQSEGRVVFLDYGCVQEVPADRRVRAQEVHASAVARDLPRFDRAAKLLLETREGALEQVAVCYLRDCFAPLLASPFRITRPYAAKLLTDMKAMGKLALRVKADEVFALPADMVFVNRLQFGFYSVLARLDVEVDYARVEESFAT